MCMTLYEGSGMTVIDALTGFGLLAESAFKGSANAYHVRYLIDILWKTLTTVHGIANERPHCE